MFDDDAFDDIRHVLNTLRKFLIVAIVVSEHSTTSWLHH